MIDKNVMLTVGGMGLLLAGRKISGISMFVKGGMGLETKWRERNPDVESGFEARWEAAAKFYEKTHQNPTNRLLHRIGIPMIVGGAAGLLLSKPFRPIWTLGAVGFGVGWALNIAGHVVFEKGAPAFVEDPLSFIAGPIWDWKQIWNKDQTLSENDDFEESVSSIPLQEVQAVAE